MKIQETGKTQNAKSISGRSSTLTGDKLFKLIAGIALIGVSVAFYRMSVFGVDAFTCMNLGVSGFIGMSFGNWQLIVNAAILILVFFTMRDKIGLGTIVNMVAVGYIADFICWLMLDIGSLQAGLLLRIIFLCIGSILAALGCALYMDVNLGVAPYDSVAFLIIKMLKGKISFRMARVTSDVTAVTIGVIFCLIAGNNLWNIIGLGTVLNALFNGPLIQFFQKKLSK